MWERVGSSGSVPQRIVFQIEQLIESKSLQPGDRLPTERDLATLLGASRPTVREAIRTLQERGWLDVRHGLGIFVTEPPIEFGLGTTWRPEGIDISELFLMREVLEVPAASWAAKIITQADVRRLRKTLHELDEAFDADPAAFHRLAQLDATFHLTIAEISGNSFMKQTSDVLHTMLISGMKTTLLIPGRREKSRDQHLRILEALVDHDAVAAGRAARSHVRSARRAAERRLSEEVSTAS